MTTNGGPNPVSRRARALERLERLTEWPLTLLAVVLTVVLIVPHIGPVSGSIRAILDTVDYVIWGTFAADLLIKVGIGPNHQAYLRRHWFEVVLVVLPVFRMLRLFRTFRALRVPMFVRALTAASRMIVTAGHVLSKRGIQYVSLPGLVVAPPGSFQCEPFASATGGFAAHASMCSAVRATMRSNSVWIWMSRSSGRLPASERNAVESSKRD